jgi:glutathione peroxidase
LEKLYEKYKWHGLEVLAFPCNQFGAQEPGTCEEIMHFAKQNFQVTFPMFDKVDVNGPNAHEVYKFLKGNLPAAQGGGKDLAWNFQKFIVNRQGQPVKLHTQVMTLLLWTRQQGELRDVLHADTAHCSCF